MWTTTSPRRHGRLRSLVVATALAALVGSAMTAPVAHAEDDPVDLGDAASHGVEAPPAVDPVSDPSADAVDGRYLVQVDGRAVAQGATPGQVRSAQDRVTRTARTDGIDLDVTTSYTTAFNGMAVRMDDAEVSKLSSVDGVVAVYPVIAVDLPPVRDAEPQDAYADAMTGVDRVQQVDGLTGAGVTVGIIDSGVDYNNPDLGGSGVDDQTKDFPNTRVAGGYDFVGDAYDAQFEDADHAPVPDAFPDDCGGHGTHVAGIVGAKGEVTGAAPDVAIASYRVFGCTGSSDSEVILAALDRAYADGVDVVNMSLGAAFMTWGDYPTAQVADALTDKGVVVVVSAGNEGESGTFSSGAPGVGSKVITVGSVENSTVRSPYVTVGDQKIAYTAATGAPRPPTSGRLSLVATGPDAAGAGSLVLACDASTLPHPTEAGQALLVRRGTCSFHDKAANAQAAGYAAVVLYNNSAGVISPTVEGDPAVTIPVISVSQADGAAVQEQLASGTVTMEWSSGQVELPNPGAGLMSSSSSYGLTADLTLKPDLSAPGGQIWSTIPLEKGGHGAMSGTSMAAPHVAGAAALLLQEHRSWTPEQVKGALVSTADPIDWSLQAGQGYLEPVHRQGSGLLDMVEAAHTSTSVAQPTISLRDSTAGGHSVTVKVRNDGDSPKTYAVGVRHGVATGGPTANPRFEVADASVRLSTRSITIAPHRAELVTVRISEDFGEDGIIYGGWVQLTSVDEDLSVPFAGMSGDYRALRILTDQGAGLPSLATAAPDGTTVALAGAGTTYSMRDGDVPSLVYHLEYPVQQMQVVAYNVTPDGRKGKPVNPGVGMVARVDHLGRDSSSRVFSWDGSYSTKKDKVKQVKDGRYILELRVLKATGDASNARHWETWTSAPFMIDRTRP